MAPSFSAGFPAGNAVLIGNKDDRSLDLAIRPDPGTGAFQWFCFELRQVGGVDMRCRIVNASAASYPSGWSGFRAAVSSDGAAWTRVPTACDAEGLRFAHRTKSERAVYAAFAPYPGHRVDRLIRLCRGAPSGSTASIATTLDGSPVPCLSIGNIGREARRCWVIGGQHGGEPPSCWFVEGFAETLLARTDPEIGGLLYKARVHIVPLLNVDGHRRGHLRGNAQGVDPNRQWASPDPDACPEVHGLLDAMLRSGVDFCLDAHTDFVAPYVYVDAVEPYLETPRRLTALRERFEASLLRRCPDFQIERRYVWAAPPSKQLLLSMCGPSVSARFDALAVTLELPIGDFDLRPDLVAGWSPARSKALGRAAALALADLVDELR